jgi:hypothetical protein
MKTTRTRWADLLFRGVPDVSAEALGLYRIVFAGLLIVAVARNVVPPEPFPQELHNHAGGVADWQVFHWLASRPDLVNHLEQLLLVALLLFGIGFLTRVSLGVAAASMVTWMLVRVQHGGVHNWAILLPAVIGILPIGWGDAFSVDEAIRRSLGRGTAGRPHGRHYGFGIWLPGFVLGLGFAAAALAKLRESGVGWILSGAVRYHFVTDAQNAPVTWGLWVASHQGVAIAMSFMAIFMEGTVILGSFVRSPAVRIVFACEALLVLSAFYVFQGELWIAWWVLVASFLPWGGIYAALAAPPMTRTAAAGGLSLRPAQLLVIGTLCLAQATASALHVEVPPWISDYPMYADTYSSTDEFDRLNPVKRVHHFRRDPDVGVPEDISRTLDEIPEADVVVIAAVSALVEKGSLSPEQKEQVHAVAEAFEKQMARPLGRVTLLVDEQAFNWKSGRFYWKKIGARIGTLDTHALTLMRPGDE